MKEFYPIANPQKIIGTLRVEITDLGFQLLGVMVVRVKDRWHFSLPSRNGVDRATGKKVQYPVFTFLNKEKHVALMLAIREQGVPFIEAYQKEHGEPSLSQADPIIETVKQTIPNDKSKSAPAQSSLSLNK